MLIRSNVPLICLKISGALYGIMMIMRSKIASAGSIFSLVGEAEKPGDGVRACYFKADLTGVMGGYGEALDMVFWGFRGVRESASSCSSCSRIGSCLGG